MKRFLSVLGFISLLIPHVSAFRDVANHSKIYPAVQSAIERGILEDGTFFRPEDYVPAQMFWEVVLRDTGFDPESATFGTPLPPNISEDDPLAQFLREGIRRGFINAEESFDKERFLSRIEAIEILVETKGIREPRANSKAFLRRVSGVPPRAPDYLRFVEAAYASKILENEDINPLNPKALLKRKDLLTWLYRFHDHGEKKSTINPRTARPSLANLRERQRTIEEQTTPSSEEKNKPLIRIQPISTGELTEVRRSGEGLHIPNGKVFESVFQQIEQKYRFSDELTNEKKEAMIEAAITAMVEKMDDKYSSYIEPAKSQEFRAGLDGEFEGIGAYVEMINGKFTITAPIKGSPAEKAGVLAGDVVTHVNDESVANLSVNEIITLIKGREGTPVELQILRDEEVQHITVTRGKITIPSITLEWEKSIPIIGIHKFTQDTKTDFARILTQEVLPRRPRGIILDLRNNPGGFLSAAVEMGEFLLDKGDHIFSVNYKDRNQKYVSSRQGELFHQENIVILQNKGTASASEIFAAAAQDHNRAVVIGTQSLGKGTVQEIVNYGNGGILKLTVAKWLTPENRWIQAGEKHGVIPDIEVADPTPEQKEQEIDPQIDAAVRHVLSH
ncbi:PDZ domain-containing protein [Candidatus Gracilibacteria bacterium]|nr:PDZ domain-containing protein [Candidatus Gracilibacteria bacterium]MCF7819827.1 PDZ domain-containing protein [Candidatus Gracilibacteria bacterium]